MLPTPWHFAVAHGWELLYLLIFVCLSEEASFSWRYEPLGPGLIPSLHAVCAFGFQYTCFCKFYPGPPVSPPALAFHQGLLSYPLIKLIGLCVAPSLELSANSTSRNLLLLRRKARYACLSPPADSRAFGARFLCQLPRIESLTKTTPASKTGLSVSGKYFILVLAPKNGSW